MKGQINIVDASFAIMIFIMVIFIIFNFVNQVDHPKYSLLSVHRSVLSVLLKEPCFVMEHDSLDGCVGVYREGLKQGTVTGYELKVVEKSNTGSNVIRSFKEGTESENIFISSRYFPCDQKLCKLIIKTYVDG